MRRQHGSIARNLPLESCTPSGASSVRNIDCLQCGPKAATGCARNSKPVILHLQNSDALQRVLGCSLIFRSLQHSGFRDFADLCSLLNVLLRYSGCARRLQKKRRPAGGSGMFLKVHVPLIFTWSQERFRCIQWAKIHYMVTWIVGQESWKD